MRISSSRIQAKGTEPNRAWKYLSVNQHYENNGCELWGVDYNRRRLTIAGGADDDVIIGGDGVDIIYGDSMNPIECADPDVDGGDDTLASGPGLYADELWGCGGDDSFIIGWGLSPDAIAIGNHGADCFERALLGGTPVGFAEVYTGGVDEPFDDDAVDEYDWNYTDETMTPPPTLFGGSEDVAVWDLQCS